MTFLKKKAQGFYIDISNTIKSKQKLIIILEGEVTISQQC